MNNLSRTNTLWAAAPFRLILGIFVAGLFAAPAAVAQWTFEPELKVGFERDDNAKLSTRTDDILDVNGFLAEGAVRFDYNSQLTDFFITPAVVSRTYDDASEIDSTDYFLRSVYRRNTEASVFRVRLDIDEQSVRTAERSDTDLDIDDPESIPDDDTGLVRFDGRRARLRVRPQWRYNFNDSSAMDLTFNYLEARYDDEVQLFLNDFSDMRLLASYRKSFSARTVGVITGTGRRYELKDESSETNGVGIMAGVERQLSETTRTTFMLGVEDTDSEISDPDPELVADISLRRRMETVNLLAQYRRSLSANGSGSIGVRDSINLNLSRRLNEKITAGLGARAYQTNSLDDQVTINERKYVQLRAQFIWNITSSFSAEVDYRYTFQKRQALTESANSNQVVVWFAYRPNSVDRRFTQPQSIEW